MKYLGLLIFSLFVITGCSDKTFTTDKEDWKESPTLVKDFIFRIGDNGHLGFGEYGPFISGESQKYMWHFWGDEKVLTKPFKVVGIKKETGEKLTVFEFPTNSVLAPNSGADHHIPSTMSLPSPGLWKLEAYFGEDLFGNVIVDVKK
ncbi:DUF4871 domain-containing protein [Metabacillus fastidiosus]|uniref:DUF4871 domain-containing protein n=1 Tax=Metabacillus fastidiosus TaxID=1458 RepID=UPI002E1C7660|nr:DUF4871 domain-containing protein [Metabacillus fastidiosus]